MEKLTNEFKIEFTKGDTYALAIKFKNITEDLRKAYFSVKENPDDTPLIQKSLGAGIDKIDDRAYKNEKTYKFQLQPADTVNLEAKVQYLYDIQVTVGNVVKTVLRGVFVLGNTITGTKSVTQEMEVAIDDELEVEVLTTPATNGVEYEQDPVALAKIGDLTKLDTDNKETVVNAINEVNKNADTNAEDINKFKNGTIELPSAKNVSGTINGKKISDIFEDDGITVSQARNSKQVNGIEITKDENGVLKVGNVIIPQEIELWSGEYIPAENSDFQNLTSTLQCGDIIRVEYRFKNNEDFTNDFVEFRIPSEEYTSINMLIEKGLITAKLVITNYNKFKAGITTAYKINSDYTISTQALAESQFAICGITKIIR